jgi:peptide/nickel transport system substrate-binding protein
MRLLRRSFWFISTYFKRYRYIILGSISFSIFLIFLFRSLYPHLPQSKQKIYIGVVGSHTISNLPEIVDSLLSAGLTQTGSDQKPIPNLSSNWEISDEGKKYTFHLKPNLTWADGSPVKSQDIKINIPKVAIEFPDDQTIIFSLPETFAPFPTILNRALFNAKGHTPTGFIATVTQNNSGNIKDIRLEKGQRIFYIKIYNSLSQAVTAFKLGHIDHLLHLNSNPEITSTPSVTITEEVDYHHLVTLMINTKDPLLADKSIRQGIAYLIQNKNQNFTKALSPIPPMSWGYNPLVKTYDYNLARGKELIKNSLPPNQKLSLELTTLPEHLKTAENLKNELANANIEINLRVVTAVPENFQLYLGTLSIPNDPDQYSLWHSTQNSNVTHIDDKKIDKLLEDGRTTIDQKQRRLFYLDFQKTLLEELPAIFLYFPNRYQVSRGNFSL